MGISSTFSLIFLQTNSPKNAFLGGGDAHGSMT